MIELWESALCGIDTDGFYGVQRSGHGGAEAGLTPDRQYHTHGFISRQLDPDDSGKCVVAYQRIGPGEGMAWVLNDPRLVSKYPALKKGGSCQYASDGSFSSFDPETHTWTLYVPYSTSPAKAHLVTVGRDGNNTPIVELASGEGPSLTILDKVTTLKNAGGSAYVVLDDSGTSIVGPFKAAGGADIGGPTSEPLSKFAVLNAALQAVAAALASIPAGLTPAGSAAAPAIATAQAAIAAFTGTGATLTTKGA